MMNQRNLYMGCLNLDVAVEGKGLISSGHYVCRCRAQGNVEVNSNVVLRLCVDHSGLGFGECCNLAYHNAKRSFPNKPASYEGCKYNKNIYR